MNAKIEERKRVGRPEGWQVEGRVSLVNSKTVIDIYLNYIYTHIIYVHVHNTYVYHILNMYTYAYQIMLNDERLELHCSEENN